MWVKLRGNRSYNLDQFLELDLEFRSLKSTVKPYKVVVQSSTGAVVTLGEYEQKEDAVSLYDDILYAMQCMNPVYDLVAREEFITE